MKRLVSIMIGLLFVLSMCCSATAASVTSPDVKCDGLSVAATEIVQYDLNDGTLTIKWTPQTAADHYCYKCIGLNEKPRFGEGDSNQSTNGTVLAEGTVTKNTTTYCKFTVSTTKMRPYPYLKIAVAAYGSDGTQRWTNFGVQLSDSSIVPVTAPAVKCDGYAVNTKDIVDYDVTDGTLTISWKPQDSADHYYYKCIGLNETPRFGDDDSNQSANGTVLAEGTVSRNTTTYCKFTVSTTKMKQYPYLKIAIAAYDSDDKAYWTNFGVKLANSSASGLTLSNSSLTFSYSGDSDVVQVSGASSFTISYPTQGNEEKDRWLTATKSGSSILISARANYSDASRSETITVTSSDGQTKTIQVTQKSGYAAPTASIRIGDTTYNSGATYGPLANGGADTLWLSVDVTNARRIHVTSGDSTIGHKDLNVNSSTSVTSHDCYFAIPAGTTPGTYTFTIYVSNSDVNSDKWAQSIEPINLNVTIVSTGGTQTYRPSAAIAYAIKYALNYNSAYSNYNSIGGDCANFISQCLIAGGFNMDAKWYWYGYGNHSNAWAGAISMRSYLKGLGYTCISSPALSDLHAGDIIWSNNGGHVMIVTKVGEGYFEYCGHNKDQLSAQSTSTGWLTHVVQMPGTSSETASPGCTHANTSWVVTQAATCTADGVKVLKCSSCGTVTKTETLAASGHTAGSWVIITEATETSTGLKRQSCTACGATLSEEVIPVAACTHANTSWVVTEAATCTANGVKALKCNNCGTITRTETITANGHTAGSWVIITEATETSTGLKRQSCTACGATLSEEVIPVIASGNQVGNITFSAGSGLTGKAGSTVTVPVSIKNPDNVALGVISLGFNLPAGITISSVTTCGAASNAAVLPGNPILVSEMNNGINGSGKIVEVTLALDSSVVFPAKIEIKPTVNTLAPESEHTLAAFAATIANAPARIPGDVTSDGKVTTADFLRLGKYLAGWDDITLNSANADVTGDGKITTADFLRLGKYLAGWDVTLQ